jgi:hypothetical protein
LTLRVAQGVDRVQPVAEVNLSVLGGVPLVLDPFEKYDFPLAFQLPSYDYLGKRSKCEKKMRSQILTHGMHV